MPFREQLKRPDLKGEFPCSVCAKVFCHSSSLSRHRMQSHFKTYNCQKCFAIVPSHETLKTHMSEQHQINRLFMCRCCNWAYQDKTTLHMHMQSMAATAMPGDVEVLAKCITEKSCSDQSANGDESENGSIGSPDLCVAQTETKKSPKCRVRKNTLDSSMKAGSLNNSIFPSISGSADALLHSAQRLAPNGFDPNFLVAAFMKEQIAWALQTSVLNGVANRTLLSPQSAAISTSPDSYGNAKPETNELLYEEKKENEPKFVEEESLGDLQQSSVNLSGSSHDTRRITNLELEKRSSVSKNLDNLLEKKGLSVVPRNKRKSTKPQQFASSAMQHLTLNVESSSKKSRASDDDEQFHPSISNGKSCDHLSGGRDYHFTYDRNAENFTSSSTDIESVPNRSASPSTDDASVPENQSSNGIAESHNHLTNGASTCANGIGMNLSEVFGEHFRINAEKLLSMNANIERYQTLLKHIESILCEVKEALLNRTDRDDIDGFHGFVSSKVEEVLHMICDS